MKSWIAAILAALTVIGVGTAIASIPNGESTEFAVSDPAVTVTASGKVEAGGTYGKETKLFTPAKGTAFTAAADGLCLVNINGQLLSSSAGGAKVSYGVVQKVNGGAVEFVGAHGISTTQGDFSGTNDASTVAKNELVPIDGGKTYEFGFGIESPNGSGTTFVTENYVCFG